MFWMLLLACRDSSEPKSHEAQCLDDYVADACFLSAVDGHTKTDREILFGMGAKFGNVASKYSLRPEWPAQPWGFGLEHKDFPAVYRGYAASCDLGLREGCHELGNFLAIEGRHPVAALGPYRRACELGLERGCLASEELGRSIIVRVP